MPRNNPKSEFKSIAFYSFFGEFLHRNVGYNVLVKMGDTYRDTIMTVLLCDDNLRFVINIPDVESQDVIRVFFQVELAHWFYLDFYLPENSELRSVSLKEFSSQMFVFCPTLKQYNDNFDQIFEKWKVYKQAVPTYGAILLDPTMQYCLLVQGYWVKASWGFPKGKVNQDEPPVECAIREVLEETGFDIRGIINPNLFLEREINEQVSRLYIIHGVSKETKFQAKTRQEIKSFFWFRIDYLPSHKKDTVCKQQYGLNPNAFFMVIPFVKELRSRISEMLQVPVAFADSSQRSCNQARMPKEEIPQSIQPSDKKRQKQQQVYSQKLQEELQEYYGYRDSTGPPGAVSKFKEQRTKSESPSYCRPGGSMVMPSKAPSSTQLSKGTTVTMKPASPSRKPSKPLQIQKGDLKIEQVYPSTKAVNSRECGEFNFMCPAWTNFKLDIDQVLNAMFPTTKVGK